MCKHSKHLVSFPDLLYTWECDYFMIQVHNLTFELCTLTYNTKLKPLKCPKLRPDSFCSKQFLPCHKPWQTSIEKVSVQWMYPRAGWVAGVGAVHHLSLPVASKVPVCKCLTHQLSTHFIHTPSVISEGLTVYETRVKKDAIAG